MLAFRAVQNVAMAERRRDGVDEERFFAERVVCALTPPHLLTAVNAKY